MYYHGRTTGVRFWHVRNKKNKQNTPVIQKAMCSLIGGVEDAKNRLTSCLLGFHMATLFSACKYHQEETQSHNGGTEDHYHCSHTVEYHLHLVRLRIRD